MKVPLFAVCQHWLKLHVLHFHHDGSPWQVNSGMCHRCCWEGRVACQHCRGTLWSSHVYCKEWLRKYQRDGQVGRRKGTRLWSVSSPAQDAALVVEAERNPLFSLRDLKNATGFPGQKNRIISRLRAAGLRARHATLKEFLTDEHKQYCLAFAESNVDRKWGRVIFTDESTFTSANDGPVLVYRPQRQRYNPQYMSTCKRSGRASVNCWGWISHEGGGILHRIDYPDALQYQHILQNVLVPSVRML